jgi:hypothetical protein
MGRAARIGMAAVAVLLAGAVLARSQTAPAPPPAVDGPNACLHGTGSRSWCGDDGPATRAKLAGPADVAAASDGSLLIADTLNNVIRRVMPDGTIVSIAGTGRKQDAPESADAADTGFRGPRGVSVDDAGDVLVADTGNHVIRSVSLSGTVSTLVGPGAPIDVSLTAPEDVVAEPGGGMLIADTGDNKILSVTANGDVSSVAGTGTPGDAGDGGPATAAELDGPTQVARAPDGDVLIADTGNGAVRSVRADGSITTLAGGLDSPRGVTGLEDGSTVVTTAGGVARIDPDGGVHQLAGTGDQGYNGDRGPGPALELDGLGQLARAPDGQLLLAEAGSDRIRALDEKGTVDTLVGSGTPRREPRLSLRAGRPPVPLARVRARAAAGSACDGYNANYATLTFLPMTRITLRTRLRSPIRIRYASSRRAKIVAQLFLGPRRVAASRARVVRPGSKLGIKIRGRFQPRVYIAKLWGRSTAGQVLRCDVKRLRIRRR